MCAAVRRYMRKFGVTDALGLVLKRDWKGLVGAGGTHVFITVVGARALSEAARQLLHPQPNSPLCDLFGKITACVVLTIR
jgi:hypothetical protein